MTRPWENPEKEHDFLRKLEEAFEVLYPTYDTIIATISPVAPVVQIVGYDVEPPGVCGDPRNGPTAKSKVLAEIQLEG